MGSSKANFAYTEQSMQKVLNERYMPDAKYIINNLFIFHWESDYLAKSRGGWWYEVEIKISLADFKADFKKEEKHFVLHYGMNKKGEQMARPNFFSYAVPEDLIDKVKDLVPDYAGLIAIDYRGGLRNVRQPVLLHRGYYKDEQLRLTEKFYHNFITYKDRYNKFYQQLAIYRKTINDLKRKYGVNKKEQTLDEFLKQL